MIDVLAKIFDVDFQFMSGFVLGALSTLISVCAFTLYRHFVRNLEGTD